MYTVTINGMVFAMLVERRSKLPLPSGYMQPLGDGGNRVACLYAKECRMGTDA